MKRLLFLILSVFLSSYAVAQIICNFRNTPLTEALRTIEQKQKDYTIAILSDHLADLRTSAKVKDLSAPDAVKLICKAQPVKVKVHGKRIYVQYERKKAVRKILLKGEVLDIRAHKPLIGATVELLNADSMILKKSVAARRYESEASVMETSKFSFYVSATPAHYIFRISYVGHKTTYVSYKLERIGRREMERTMPPFFMTPLTTILPDVSVIASKVKFYYKGDTLIYNADAFILAEGSMLDALIGQLPGVELKRDGRIYHNGKFVDDLLLNGKQFFGKKRKLMLENLPAYTVKDIAIYDKQTDENEWLGIEDKNTQRHVIDVRLKKEYMVGWIANAEVGGGTHDRYLARLFAMRNSDFSRLAVIANANNLDDDSKPGENDNWQRGGNDLRRTECADMQFNVSDRNKRWEFYSTASVNHQRAEDETRTVSQNYLPTGDTYDHSYSNKRNEDLHFTTSQDFFRNYKNVRWRISPNMRYHRFEHSSDLASATFNAPVASVSRQLLDDLYSPTSSRINLRDTLVNRILGQGVGNGHSWDGTLGIDATVKIQNSNDYLHLGGELTYSDRDERVFNRQTVNIGSETTRASYRHQFYDNHPTRNGNANLMVGYNLLLGSGMRKLNTYYAFDHRWKDRRSSLYLLDRLDQEPSAIDDLPSVSDYQQVMDRSNSFDSHFMENSHKLRVNLGYEWDIMGKHRFGTLLNGNINLRQQTLDYQRGSIDTTLHRNAFTIDMYNTTVLDLKGGHQVTMTLAFREELPDLEQRIDLRDDTDPMNIRLGNSSLRSAITTGISLHGSLECKRSHHFFEVAHHRTDNALAVSYVYNTKTGVRTYRPENVNGNWHVDFSYTLNQSLDSASKFTLDIPFNFIYNHFTDLVGVTSTVSPQSNTELLRTERSNLHRLTFSLSPTFRADIGKHHFNLTFQPTVERHTSDRQDFQNFSAFTCRTSLAAIMKLPWKFDLSTDLTLYSRTGYVDDALNTNDLVWNARLSRPFFKGKFLVAFDAFDLLGQLSNVTRTINAQGRTETWANVMPRYALLHVVYRFSKTPKK